MTTRREREQQVVVEGYADKTDGELVLKIGKGVFGPFNMPATVRATVGAVTAEAKLELIGK